MFNLRLHKINLFIIIILLLLTINVRAADEEMYIGKWQGAIVINEQNLNILINFEKIGNTLKGTIDIPQQNLTDYPVEIKELTGENIVFLLSNIPGDPTFSGSLNEDRIEGKFSQHGSSYNFFLKRDTSSQKEVDQIKLKGREEEISIPVRGGNLEGTLTFPKVHDNKDPVAIIIAGSGPTNRNGNTPLINMKINNLKDIVYHLANNGILSIRFDKRGVGESSNLVDKKTPPFSQYRNDIINIIDYIKRNLGRREEQIFLIGHSEGSTLAIMTAEKVNNLAGLVLLAGPGFKQETLLKNQLARQNKILYENDKIESEDILIRALDDLIIAIENEQEFNINEYNIPEQYRNVYLSLNNQREFSKEWLKTDPASILSNLHTPTCIIQGSNDQQVSKEDAEKLSKAVNDEIEDYHYIEGVNHLLFKEQNQVDEEVLRYIVNFIKQNK